MVKMGASLLTSIRINRIEMKEDIITNQANADASLKEMKE
jgi:hypothetical protein